ncbi:hypothetical protein AL035_05110 [Salipiger aestuarii]|uniref:Uncharacterized protein n=1 Tax=Salipiger aestuarii TaxID=568098 RepID=A0A327YHE2_9RHOB|nr:hypothetical protein [Salipiger aestuarii]KAB2542738.1 hypothetical protein AL035_05110 [Salipiger aestuarii]RAK20324.1 hypothetical protein ATI53_1006102 [Salipiger aestuarii]
MAIDLILYPKRNLAYLRFFGVTTPAEYIGVIERLQGDPHCRPGTALFADLSGIADLTSDFLQVLSMVGAESRLTRNVLPGTRYAFYAPDDLAFGASRMYHQVADNTLPYRIDVFRSEAAALDHIGQPERKIADFLRAAR